MKKWVVIKPVNILILFVILNLIIGLFITPDFGKSTDEKTEGIRSSLALSIYLSKGVDLLNEYEDLELAQYYGTASTIIIRFIEHFFFPNITTSTNIVAHYCYFVFFQASIIGLFYLTKYFLEEWSSLVVSILFGTQPLLFGHGFINPKDIPLLTVFMFTVLTGFKMVEKWKESLSGDGFISETTSPEGRVNRGQTKKRRYFIFALSSIFLILWCRIWLKNLLLGVVEYSYITRESSLPGKIFEAFTTYGSLEGYLSLANQYFFQIFLGFLLATPFLLLGLYILAGRNRLFSGRINLTALLASAVWGGAISTRVIAVAAGGIVGLYALAKLKEKAILPLIFYSLTASIFSYISWPYLWVKGFTGYLDSLVVFSDFPWPGNILFEGQVFTTNDLPIWYLPKLMFLQFTEPLVILALLGFLISLYLLVKKEINTTGWLLLAAWFFLPIIYTIISNSSCYHNFRQFLFITPPLFISAGLAIQNITLLLKKNLWKLAFCLCIIIPGILPLIQVHPFQYIYYNRFVGGIEGAYGNYDLDFMGIGWKNAMDYVNENFKPGTKILIWKNNLYGEIYATKDFEFVPHTTIPEQEYSNYDYAIMPDGHYDDIEILKEAAVIHTVGVDNASLIVVLKITDGVLE